MIKKLLKPYLGMPREIYIIFISKTVNAMGALIYPFIALLLTKKIGLSEGEAGMWMVIAGIFAMPASIFGGYLSDRFGRKKILVTFESIAMLGYLVAALLEANIQMVYVLIFSSTMFNIAGPSHDAMIADLTNQDQRQGAYSLGYLGFNLGFAFAQIIAGTLFEEHYKWMFIIDAITAFIGIGLIAFFVKETKDRKTEQEETEKMEQHVEGSILKVLRARPILIYFAIAAFGYKLVYSNWSFTMPLFAEFSFVNEGAKLFGWLGSANAVVVVVFTPIITALFNKKSNIKRIIYAGILFAVGFGMLGFVSTKVAFFTSICIWTLGEILEAISTMPFIMNHTPASHRGRMSSVIPIIMGAGYTIGPVIFGNMIEWMSYDNVWMIVGIIALSATALMKLLEIYDKKTNIAKSELIEKVN